MLMVLVIVLTAAAITEELLKITEDKQGLSTLRGFDSPFYHTTETLTGCQFQGKMQSSTTSSQPGSVTQDTLAMLDKADNIFNTTGSGRGIGGGRGGDGRALAASFLDQSWSFQSSFTPIDANLHRSPLAPEDDTLKFSWLSPSPCGKTPSVPLPYESFFELALPRAASLFVGQRTWEAAQKVAAEGLQQWEEGLENGEEEEGVASASPLEVLDRLVQQGSDAHDKVLKR